MRPTIEYLWSGNIASAEKCGIGDPEIESLEMLMRKHKESLSMMLSQQEIDVLTKYIECTEEYVYLVSKCAFCDGFSLASKLMAEALSLNS